MLGNISMTQAYIPFKIIPSLACCFMIISYHFFFFQALASSNRSTSKKNILYTNSFTRIQVQNYSFSSNVLCEFNTPHIYELRAYFIQKKKENIPRSQIEKHNLEDRHRQNESRAAARSVPSRLGEPGAILHTAA